MMGRVSSMGNYEIIIYWSDEDSAFIAEVPELPGCMAHGDTYESALANVRTAIELWTDTAKEFGDPVPKPKGRRLMLGLLVRGSSRTPCPRSACRSGTVISRIAHSSR